MPLPESWRNALRHLADDSRGRGAGRLAEADLFRLLIRDLSTGGVIRQERETTADGDFYKKRPAQKSSSRLAKSSFDDVEPYVLTSLGKDFVHYALTEVVLKLEAPAAEPEGSALA